MMRRENRLKIFFWKVFATYPGSYLAVAIAYAVGPVALAFDCLAKITGTAKNAAAAGFCEMACEPKNMPGWANPESIREGCRRNLARSREA